MPAQHYLWAQELAFHVLSMRHKGCSSFNFSLSRLKM